MSLLEINTLTQISNHQKNHFKTFHHQALFESQKELNMMGCLNFFLWSIELLKSWLTDPLMINTCNNSVKLKSKEFSRLDLQQILYSDFSEIFSFIQINPFASGEIIIQPSFDRINDQIKEFYEKIKNLKLKSSSALVFNYLEIINLLAQSKK